MKKRVWEVFGIFIFILALVMLYRELHQYRPQELVENLKHFSPKRIAVALALTFLNYVVLTFYDFTAFRYIDHPLKYKKIALASFIGNAFSNNISFSGLAGTSVRYRMYSNWGLSALEITQVVFFYHMTFLLGFLALGSWVFVTEPQALSGLLHLSAATVRLIGIFCGFPVIFYGLSVIFNKSHTLRILKWRLHLPSVSLLGWQFLVACVEWIVSAAVLYALFPAHPVISFWAFTGVFLFVQLFGFLSQVPGGLGVLETGILKCLTPAMPAPVVFAGLLAFRAVYYLLPFFAAIIFLTLHEVREKHKKLR